MSRVEMPAPKVTPPAGQGPDRPEGPARPDRREREKQRTRDALIQAAMELFEAKGYDHTAVHEITDAVDVSERTFFRYFASKEDLVLSFARDGMTAFTEALAGRDDPDPEKMAAAFDAYAGQVVSALTGRWTSRPGE